MRLFLAIELPDEVRARLAADTARLRELVPEVSWVQRERLHVTLKFLGELSGETATSLAAGLGPVVARHRSFSVDLAGVGSYPNFGRPRVVWIGVRDDSAVSALARDVEASCSALGLAADERAFSAHVTLARVKRPLRPFARDTLKREAAILTGSYHMEVSHIQLMQSVLSSAGPTYNVVSSLTLDGS